MLVDKETLSVKASYLIGKRHGAEVANYLMQQSLPLW